MDLDERELNRLLDRVKTKVFLGNNGAFLGSLMTTLDFEWNDKIPTAATNGRKIMWNPKYFEALCPEGRISIFVHELWHVGLMHILRRGTRIPKIWNYACDTVLDNQMHADGYCVDERLFPAACGFPPGSSTCVNLKYADMSAEQIYDEMIKDAVPIPMGYDTGRGGDMSDPEDGLSMAEKQIMIANVVQSQQVASMSSKRAGNMFGEVESILSTFLKPKLPWRQLLLRFFTELGEQDYSWSKPNRRYQDIYLPSLQDQEGALDHLAYYLDVSGSVSDADVLRFNSEVKYIKDHFNPKKLTLCLFDTKIQKEIVFMEEDRFDKIVVVGRGGTSLTCVRNHIQAQQPTAAVIFSDLECSPMQKLDKKIPLIWVAVNNANAVVNEGKIIHIRE